jgi:hypothetical protein
MTRNTNSLGIAFLAILFFAAGSAAGQDSKIALFNGSTHQLTICFHRVGSDPEALIRPIECVTLASNASRYITRVEKEFSMRVLRSSPKVVLLHNYAKVENIYEEITFSGGQPSFKIRPEHQILKVCNQTSPDPVHFVLSFDNGKALYTKGWWKVAQNECLEFLVSRMMNENWKVPYGTRPRTHYYARTFGAKPIVWSGGEKDQQNCIYATEITVSESLSSLSARISACPNNETTKKVWMRRLADPKVTDRYYYLTF